MTEQKYISELHNDHKLWLSELTLGKDELMSFRFRLEEASNANSGIEVTSMIEQFQNRFIRENEVIDTLLHEIRLEEKSLTANVAANTTAADHRKVADNASLRDQMASYQKMFAELKEEFIRFLSKTL